MESVATVQAVEEKAARWEDFIDIYIAPAALFARRENESAKIPMISLAIIMVVMYYALLPLMTPIHQAGIAQAITRTRRPLSRSRVSPTKCAWSRACSRRFSSLCSRS